MEPQEDIYTRLAMLALGVEYMDVTKEQRRKFKTALHQSVYGDMDTPIPTVRSIPIIGYARTDRSRVL